MINVIIIEILLLRRRHLSWQNVPSGEEWGKMSVFAGYIVSLCMGICGQRKIWINQKLWLAAHFLCRFHCHHCTTNFVKLLSWKILIIVVNVYKGFSFIPCLKLDWNRDVIVVIISKIIASSMVIVATWFFWKYQHQGSFVFYTADLCFLHLSNIYVVISLFATTPTAAVHFS